MRDKPYEFADSHKANRECGVKPGQQLPSTCPRCKRRVILHCAGCEVQISGCICTEVDRFGEDEAWQRATKRWGDKLARERMGEAGFWTPNE